MQSGVSSKEDCATLACKHGFARNDQDLAPAAAAATAPTNLQLTHWLPAHAARTSVTSGPNTMPTPRASLVRKPGSATCNQAGNSRCTFRRAR